MTVPDPVELASALIRAESVTPAGPEAFDICERALSAAGFAVERMVFAEREAAPVENLYATAGNDGRHIALAGHVDVVPPGPDGNWSHPPFSAAVDGDTLYGRGAQDMKGAVAAMICAAAMHLQSGGTGRISLLITGDEEGPAINGTRPLARWCSERTTFDAALVGEPTSREVLGDTIKIGRRGSLTGAITVHGRQGHVAYQHLADNPVPALLACGQALLEPLDLGSDDFAPSNLEITTIDVGNPAHNVIPGEAMLRFNVRFNDRWTLAKLKDALAARVRRAAATADVTISWQAGESDVFLTRDDDVIEKVSAAVQEATGVLPEATTGGGTSDARFLKDYCPVIEFGAVGSTMHQVDERTSVTELRRLTEAYRAIIARLLAPC
ncbi:MAG: succinyl-diaminopimelate desuccinylase [Pseudomonadota bacterium]